MTERNYRVRGTAYVRHHLSGSQGLSQHSTLAAAQEAARRAVRDARKPFGISCAWIEVARNAPVPDDEPTLFHAMGFEPSAGLWPGKKRECVR